MSGAQEGRAGSQVILVHTNYDEQTRIMSGWASELTSVVPILKRLPGNEATSANLRAAVAGTKGPIHVVFYGHGTEQDLLEYHSDTPGDKRSLVGITGQCVVPAELSNHRIYAVACWAGSELGPALRAAGAEFIGYQYAFWFAPGFHHRFKEIVNNGLIDWVQGKSGKEVWQKLWDSWDALFVKKRHPKAAIHMNEETFAAAIALYNRDSVVYYGPKDS